MSGASALQCLRSQAVVWETAAVRYRAAAFHLPRPSLQPAACVVTRGPPSPASSSKSTSSSSSAKAVAFSLSTPHAQEESFGDIFANAVAEHKGPLTRVLHGIWRQQHRSGDVLVDATVGNGLDSKLLASLSLGDSALVHGFDVQKGAIEQTRLCLEAEGLEINLHHCSHALLASKLVACGVSKGTVGNIVFNLGYLPGSDKSVITKPTSTLEAINQALPFLRGGGIISLLCYVGHEGGKDEYRQVTRRCKEICDEEAENSTWRMYEYDPHSEGKAPELCPKIVILLKTPS